MKFRFYNIALAIFLLPGGTQAADNPPPLNIKAHYDFDCNGVDFGEFGVEIAQDSSHYTIAGDVGITGVLRWFVKHSSHTTVEANGKDYGDKLYETHYHTNKKPRYVQLAYKNGRFVSQTLDPPADPAKRPLVPDAQKQGSVDPLSFILEMRAKLAQATAGGAQNYTIDVYDGNRLTRANFTVADRGSMDFGDKPTNVIKVQISRTPLAGFTDKELADMKSDPTVTAYFSDDERLIPLRLEVVVWFGTLTANLSHECTASESCLLGNKD